MEDVIEEATEKRSEGEADLPVHFEVMRRGGFGPPIACRTCRERWLCLETEFDIGTRRCFERRCAGFARNAVTLAGGNVIDENALDRIAGRPREVEFANFGPPVRHGPKIENEQALDQSLRVEQNDLEGRSAPNLFVVTKPSRQPLSVGTARFSSMVKEGAAFASPVSAGVSCAMVGAVAARAIMRASAVLRPYERNGDMLLPCYGNGWPSP